MYQTKTKPGYSATDDELVDVLTQISVVSMRLARKLTLLAGQRQSTKGGKTWPYAGSTASPYHRADDPRHYP